MSREEMQALTEYEADQCPGCGGTFSETTAKANTYAYTGEMVRCHSCTAIAGARAVATKPAEKGGLPHTTALYFTARKR